MEGWKGGGTIDICSKADITHKYDNQACLIMFVREYDICGFLKTTSLEGEKKHVSIRETKGGEGMGGG